MHARVEMSASLKRPASSRRGQAAIFISASLVVVLGLVGLAVDVGWAYFRKLACKAAAQSAALAGARVAENAPNWVCGNGVRCQAPTACPSTLNNPLDPIQAACMYAKQNGFINDPVNGRQQVLIGAGNSMPPVSGLSPTYWMSATVSEKTPLWFGSMLGVQGLTVSVRSTAGYFHPSVGGCIYSLEQTAVAVTNSGNTILSTGCGMYVNSNNPAAISLNGNPQIIANNGSTVNIVGGCGTAQSCADIGPAPPRLGVPVLPNPFEYMRPPNPPSSIVTGVNLTNFDTLTISSSVVQNGIVLTGHAALTLNPGVYYIQGGISISGQATINGTGVMLYIHDGTVNLSGGTSLNLTAPTSGDWQGILIYQDENDANAATVVGGTRATVSGVMYFPNANLSFAGGSDGSRMNGDIVAKTLTLLGNAYIQNPITTRYTSGTSGTFPIE